jgi:hypothetical protein
MNASQMFRRVVTFSTITAAAFGQDLNWLELSRRPELWPTQCTVLAAMKFDGGVTVQSGQKVKVIAVKPNQADVATLDGKTNFAAEPNEIDLLKVANAALAKLTPKQRALTYASIAQQKELWPASVTLTKPIKFTGGAAFREGDQLPVVHIKPDRIMLRTDVYRTTFELAPQDTELILLARQFVEDPKAGPRWTPESAPAAPVAQNNPGSPRAPGNAKPPGLLGQLDGKLLSSVSGKPQPLDPAAPPRYFVFIRGSSTCPITRQFTPSLIKFYNQMKPSHPDFEIIWIMTESPEDTGKFAKELGFSWRAVTYESTPSMPIVNAPISGLLPQLIVLDSNGRILANGSQNAAPNALRQLDTLLKQTPR